MNEPKAPPKDVVDRSKALDAILAKRPLATKKRQVTMMDKSIDKLRLAGNVEKLTELQQRDLQLQKFMSKAGVAPPPAKSSPIAILKLDLHGPRSALASPHPASPSGINSALPSSAAALKPWEATSTDFENTW